MRGITLQAPAKINLILKVINKRPDGFHNLKTLFERINLCDEVRLTLRKTRDIQIKCTHPGVPCGAKNTCYRAANLLQERYAVSSGVSIEIIKRIPVAAGLAGGSSNAASVLMGLNQLWGLSLTKGELIGCGKEIGSDVPFFLHKIRFGLGRSKGDQIREISINRKFWHILVVPCVKMYTPEVYKRLNLQLTKTSDNVNIFIRHLKKNDVRKARALLSNDLNYSILRIRPQLGRIIKRLNRFGIKDATFSGSGPAVFGLFSSQIEAETLRFQLGKIYKQVYAVQTL